MNPAPSFWQRLWRRVAQLPLALVGLLLFALRRSPATRTAACDDEALGRNYRQLALVSLTLLIVVSLLAATVWGSLLFFPRQRVSATEPLIHSSQLEEMPRLPNDVAEALDALQASKQERLRSYGWVDREAGVVHIPIERAIELLAERGLEGRE